MARSSKEILDILSKPTMGPSVAVRDDAIAHYCVRCGLSSFSNKKNCIRCGHRLETKTEFMSKENRHDWDDIVPTNW